MDNNRLTARDVEALLLEHSDEYSDQWDWPDWSEVAGRQDAPNTMEVVGLGEVKVWDHSFGDIETNTAYLMFQVGDRIFRKEGLWVSHWGMNWDYDFSEVKPVQKVITDYEAVKE